MTALAASNPRIKQLKRLLTQRPERAARGQFLADGPKAVEGAREAGSIVETFVVPGLSRDYPGATVVDERALASLSDATTPAGVVALCAFIDVPLAAALTGSLVSICADVRDPGNAGTVIRCADAAGADGVVLAGDSVDLYNPKTIRASVGSAFHLPIAVERDPASAVRAAQEAGFTVLAADGAGEVELWSEGWDRLVEQAGGGSSGPRIAWLFGNEAWGLPDDLATLADHRVRIPIHGRAESLNLATAAALCLYASAQAQRPPPD